MSKKSTSVSGRGPFLRAALCLLLGAAAGTAVTICCARLDGTSGGGIFSILAGVVLSAVILLIIRCSDGPGCMPRGTLFSRYLPLVLLFPAIFLVLRPGMFSRVPPSGEFVLWSLNLLTAVLWEELFFRHVALLLFGRGGLFRLPAVLFVNLIFGAFCFFCGIRFLPAGSEAAQAAAAVCTGVFLTSLLLRTRNVLVPMLASFLMRFTAWLSGRSSLGGQEEDLLSALILCALALTVGGILILRGRRAEQKNGN